MPEPKAVNAIIGKKLAIAFVGLFLLVGLNIWTSISTIRRFDQTNTWVHHTYDVIGHLRVLLAALGNAESAQRGYLLSREDNYLKPYYTALQVIHTQLSALESVTKDNPQQYERTVLLRSLVENRLAQLNTGIEAARAMRGTIPSQRGLREMEKIRDLLQLMENEEQRLLSDRIEISRAQARRIGGVFSLNHLLEIALIILVFFLLNRDLRRRQQSEQSIRELNASLEQRATELTAVNRELEAFSYSVSHDLRAPLRAINGFSEMVIDQYSERLDAEGIGYLSRVQKAAIRMGQLIDGMLSLSRLTRSGMHWQRVDLSAMAQDIVDEFRQSDPGRALQFHCAAGLSAEGDEQLLRIVLTNLLGNAWKFTRRQPAAVVELGASQEQGQTIYFVRDNGAGFDMMYIGQLFGAFHRLHTDREFPGTGIGLATVQRIIHRHRGRIWAQARVDQGATFFFTLGETGDPTK